jgi:signal transduction histidine kinase
LHNIGNVLNSVNVSTSLLAEHVRASKIAGVRCVAELLRPHQTHLRSVFNSDGKAQQLVQYLDALANELETEQKTALKELKELAEHVDHIKGIVAVQQSYATVSGVTTIENLVDLVEDSLRMNQSALKRHGVALVRDYAESIPKITVDRHKVVQILVNLLRNAKQACDESGRHDKQIAVRVTHANDQVRIALTDNGIGISPENLTRIFNHGFTTRKDGHGFGLHSGALAAKEMGGALVVQSNGIGQGATFVLELPV